MGDYSDKKLEYNNEHISKNTDSTRSQKVGHHNQDQSINQGLGKDSCSINRNVQCAKKMCMVKDEPSNNPPRRHKT